jgi:transcriptional regulator with XRE-family HTH domain
MSTKKLDSLSARIKYTREINGLNKKSFADRLGVSGAYVTELESGKGKKISKPLAKLISYEFGISSTWVESGEGEVEASISKDVSSPTDHQTSTDNERIVSEKNNRTESLEKINRSLEEDKQELRADKKQLTAVIVGLEADKERLLSEIAELKKEMAGMEKRQTGS